MRSAKQPIVIAVDGPAASGKGTIARALAEHFGLPHMDTGMLYRAVALSMFRFGGDPGSEFEAVRACDGTAQVELDYVTPRFRDFSPGEFVFRHSSLFRNQGFREVLTPPGMVAPYYQRLGFTPAGDRFRLDLA